MARVDRFGFKGIASKSDIRKIEQEATSSSCPESTYEAVHSTKVDNPNEKALSFFMLGGEYKRPFTFTYTDLVENINATANMLRSLGIEKGDVVGIILPNLPETCFAMVAAQTVGISFAINPLLEKELLKELLIVSKAKVVVTIGPFVKTDVWEKVDAVRHDVPNLEHVVKVDMSTYLRGIKKSIVKAICLFKNKGGHQSIQKVHDYSSLTNQFPKDKLEFQVDISPSDPAAYFHTGGTTGRPKIAIQTQENICFDCWSTGHNLNTDMDEFNVYGGLPLFHVFGAMVMLSMCWAGSGHLVLAGPKGFRGEGVLSNFWRTISHYRINVLAAVPAVYGMLIDSAGADARSSGLKFAISGAAPLPVEVMKKFKTHTGIEILEGYGCTEGTCMVAVNPPYGERKLGSVGFPIPFTQAKVLKIVNNGVWEDADTNEVGSVCLRGKHVFRGYLEEEDNRSIWIEHLGERFFNTGDLGKYDSDGYLWLTGRSKELIIRGGHNIDPLSIESPFYEHSDVELVAAVGRPDERVGELPVVYVQLKPGANATPEDLYVFVASRIHEKSALPKEIIIIDKMPMTTIGKIFKPELCMLEIKKVCESVLLGRLDRLTIEVVNSRSTGYTALIHDQTGKERDEISALLSNFSFANKMT